MYLLPQLNIYSFVELSSDTSQLDQLIEIAKTQYDYHCSNHPVWDMLLPMLEIL